MVEVEAAQEILVGLAVAGVLRDLGVQVVAIPVRAERRQELEAQGWTCAGSLRDAADLGASAVVVATDTRRHVQDAKEALCVGMHILVEKPLAVSAVDAQALPSIASKYGTRIAVGCNLRFDKGLQRFRQRCDEIGDVHGVRIECRSYLPDWRPGRNHHVGYWARPDEGGVLRDLIHEVDYALWLFGVPEMVFGAMRPGKRLGIEAEEYAEGGWTTAPGAVVSLALDYLTRRAQRTIRAWGAEGEMKYDLVARKLRIQFASGKTEEEVFPESPNDCYVAQAKEFLRFAQEGTSTVIAKAEDGIAALAVCDAWRRSSQTRSMEKVVQ